MKKIIVLAVFLPIAGFLYAQDFGFGDDEGDNGGSGGKTSALSVTVGGEVSAALLGYVDDFSKGANHTRLGDVFSGKLNFSAGTSFADGVIKFKLQTSPQPVSIDEAYVRAYFGDLELEGGLRKLTWGKADSLGPLDVVNPLDYSEMTDLSDTMNLKIARPLIHASYRVGSFTKIEGLFVPTFEPLRYAEKGSRWEPAQVKMLNNLPNQLKEQVQTNVQDQLKPLLPLPPVLAGMGIPYTLPTPTITSPSVFDKPDDISTFAYAQAGLRFTTTVGPADIGFQYYYGRLTRPAVSSTITTTTTFISVPLPPPLPSQLPIAIDTKIDLNYAYNPYHQIGVDWAQILYGFNIRAELAANITYDSKGDDGSIYNPALLWSLGFDRDLIAGINLNFQCNESIRLMNDKIGNKTLTDGAITTTIIDTEAGTNMTSTQIITAVTKKFFRDELETRIAVMWGIEDKDFLFIPSITWTRDTISIEFSAGIFGGDREGQFGQFKDNSFLRAALTYSF